MFAPGPQKTTICNRNRQKQHLFGPNSSVFKVSMNKHTTEFLQLDQWRPIDKGAKCNKQSLLTIAGTWSFAGECKRSAISSAASPIRNSFCRTYCCSSTATVPDSLMLYRLQIVRLLFCYTAVGATGCASQRTMSPDCACNVITPKVHSLR